MKNLISVITMTIAICVVIVGCRDSKTPQFDYSFYNQDAVEEDRTAETPAGWTTFATTTGAPIISTPEKVLADLTTIFDTLAADFTYAEDIDKHGVEDLWVVMDDADLEGDDEDFALTLRAKLIADGFREANVRIALGEIDEDDDTVTPIAGLFVELSMGDIYVVTYASVAAYTRYGDITWTSILDETGLYWVVFEK